MKCDNFLVQRIDFRSMAMGLVHLCLFLAILSCVGYCICLCGALRLPSDVPKRSWGKHFK